MLRDLLTVVIAALIAQGAITTSLLIGALRRHRTRHRKHAAAASHH